MCAVVVDGYKMAGVDREKIYQWINDLTSLDSRETALLELSKKRETVQDLAPMLWHSFGTIAALLQVGKNMFIAYLSILMKIKCMKTWINNLVVNSQY